jgi:hypothetical protein
MFPFVISHRQNCTQDYKQAHPTVEIAARERVRMQGPDTYRDKNITLVPSRNKRIIVLLRDCEEKQSYISEINKAYLKF